MSVVQTLEIEGLYCAACVGRAERVLARVPGLQSAQVNLAQNSVRLTWAGAPDPAAAREALSNAGYGLVEQVSRLAVEGMTCASCTGRIERLLVTIPEVETATASLVDGSVTIRHLAGPEVVARAIALLDEAGYPARPLDEAPPDRAAREEAAMRTRAIQAGLLTLPIFVTEMGGHVFPAFHHWLMGVIDTQLLWWIQGILATLVLLGPGRIFLQRGLPALWRLAPDMNSLVAVGTLAAWGQSMVVLLLPDLLPEEARSVWFEAAAVIVTLILIGRWLEARARGRTGAAIRGLMALQPDSALVETPDGAEERPARQLKPGDVLRIRPGERLAADGVVVTGDSWIDESMITGEPVPVQRVAGDAVIGGTVNGTGALRVEVTHAGADTRLARILRMVADAQGAKLPIQAMVDRVTRVFVPVVMAIAALAVLGWWLAGGGISQALVAGVSVLIVACPCAMGLATPTSILVGTGRAAELGVLFRKGEALQRLAAVRSVGFDKTGTLTEGHPALVDMIILGDRTRADLLGWAAAIEAFSEHPVASAIRAAAGDGVAAADDILAIPGHGVTGRVGPHVLALGNGRLMADHAAMPDDLPGRVDALAAEGRTVLMLAVDGRVEALLLIADPVKAGSAAAIRALGDLGIETFMVSGDAQGTAAAVGRGLGLDRVHGGVLPEGKVQVIRDLAPAAHPVAFVGDGINDAPVLAAAEVGIAMGQGTDVAIEAADVVLASGDPGGVAVAVRIARATMRNIRQNLFWAFAYNAALIPVAAGVLQPWTGWMLSPMLAAGAMALSSVFVLGNALRLRRA